MPVSSMCCQLIRLGSNYFLSWHVEDNDVVLQRERQRTGLNASQAEAVSQAGVHPYYWYYPSQVSCTDVGCVNYSAALISRRDDIDYQSTACAESTIRALDEFTGNCVLLS